MQAQTSFLDASLISHDLLKRPLILHIFHSYHSSDDLPLNSKSLHDIPMTRQRYRTALHSLGNPPPEAFGLTIAASFLFVVLQH